MTTKKIKTSDILGDNYYTYELTSSNYTPALNDTITITCTMKDVYGAAAGSKSITLYQNDTSKGAKTTNSSGVVTWSITCSSAGLQKFNIKDTSIEVFVDNKAVSSHQHGNITSDGKLTTSHNGIYSTFVGVQDSTGTLYKASKINSDIIIDGTAHANIGSNANDNQSAINTAINTALGDKANSNHSHSLSSLGGTVTVEKQSTAESGYAHTYVIKQNNTQVGSKINIPKDFLVKSATLNTCSTVNNPVSGYSVGDKYLDFVVNAKDNSATDEHLYVLVSDLVDDMTVDEELSSSSENPVQNMVIYDAIDTLNGDLSNDILYTRLDLLGCNTFTIKDFTNPNNWTTPNNCTYSDGTLTFTGSNSFSANFPTQSFAGYDTGFEFSFDYVVDNGLVLNERIVWECLGRQFSYVITSEDVSNGKIVFDISFIADENGGIIESEADGEYWSINDVSVSNPYTINAITPLGTSTKITNIKYKANNIYSLNDNVNELQQNISDKEDKTNKVTSISSSSTDTQYPSAKCVFDKLNGYLTSNEEVIFVNGTNQSTDTTTNTFTGTTSKLDSINSVVDGTKLIYKVSVTSTNDTNDLRLSLGTNSGVVERYIKSDNTYTTANLYPKYTLLFLVFFNGAWHIIGQSNPKLKNRIVDLIYPIGSIYMSVNNVSPQVLFGGTWEQIQDRFLLASGQTYQNGTTGGEATHTLTISEMPSHTHTQNAHSHTIGSLARYTTGGNGNAAVGNGYGNTQDYGTSSTTATNKNTGGGGSHNNMPPYLAVYIWKRIA